MKQVYVIVHDWCLSLKMTRMKYKANVALAKLNLWWVEKTKEHYHVNNEPREINLNLPLPSKDLEVLVCGAFTDACVSFQCDALKEKGYNARIHYPGCFQP